MSFKEINELRKAGKLDEALEMVNQALTAEPDNIWNKRAAAWVYYEYLKKYSQPESYDDFKKSIIKLKDLNLPQDEKMVFDNSAWQIGSMLFALQKEENVDYDKISELFDVIKEFHFTKPSESFSFIYKAFHKGHQNWSRYKELAEWWDFKNFRPEDYLTEEFNGIRIMAVAEQAYIAYSKKLLEGAPVDSFGHNRAIDKDEIQVFLPKLDLIIDKHPDYQYPPYFKAKLLLALGDDKNVLSAFLPFAKQKRNDFWVWELMAEIFMEDKDTQFACFCKALSLKAPEDFLVKLRQSFASILVDRQMYSEAKTEIEKVIATRAKHEWKLPNQITQWVDQDWYKSNPAKKDNKELYAKHVNKAEEILFQNVPEEIVAVEFVNEGRTIINFVKNRKKHGFFNYSGHLSKVKVGDILSVRFNGEGQDGFYKVLTAKKADSHLTTEAIKAFEGNLKIISPHNFGFIQDVFVDPKLIQENNLTEGQELIGKAILSFNKKKSEWGWKAFSIEI